jgi:hypothetical protein
MATSSHGQPALAASSIKAQPQWTPNDPVDPQEQALLDHALAGTLLDLAGDGRVDHEAMNEWGPARTVRAAVLRHLLVEQMWPVHSKGVRLRGARISGPLDLESATLRCPLLLEDCYLDSLDPVTLDYATVSRIVLSRCRVAGGLTASLLVATKDFDLGGSAFEGVVRLVEADITGQLVCRGAKLTGTNRDGNTLACDRMKVGGDAFLDQEFTAAGTVSIVGARINGSVWLNGAELAEPVALRAGGVHVDGQLVWSPRSPVRGLVDLERAAVHRLDDNWDLPYAHWPPAGRLRLAGFSYDGFGGQHWASWRQRLEWIRRSHTTATDEAPATFAAQPYEQLARVYRQNGQEAEARHIAIARRNDLRHYGALTRSQQLGSWLSDKTFGHGYQPWRAIAWLIALYLAVLLVFSAAQNTDGAMVPAKDTMAISSVPTASQCSSSYPCFSAARYASEIVFPAINWHQAEYWRLGGSAAWISAYTAVESIATPIGWALTTLAVAAFTGIFRRD